MERIDRHIEREQEWPAATLESICELGQFAWPGGYEVFYVTDDGLILCQPCALAEARAGFEQGPIYYQSHSGEVDEFTNCDVCYHVIVEGEEPF